MGMQSTTQSGMCDQSQFQLPSPHHLPPIAYIKLGAHMGTDMSKIVRRKRFVTLRMPPPLIGQLSPLQSEKEKIRIDDL